MELHFFAKMQLTQTIQYMYIICKITKATKAHSLLIERKGKNTIMLGFLLVCSEIWINSINTHIIILIIEALDWCKYCFNAIPYSGKFSRITGYLRNIISECLVFVDKDRAIAPIRENIILEILYLAHSRKFSPTIRYVLLTEWPVSESSVIPPPRNPSGDVSVRIITILVSCYSIVSMLVVSTLFTVCVDCTLLYTVAAAGVECVLFENSSLDST